MNPDMSAKKTSIENTQAVIVDGSEMAVEVPKKSSRLTKKHVVIAVVSLLVVGLIVAGVLVAIRIYTDSQKEIVKYQMTYKDRDNSDVKQTVSVDDNVVMYHAVKQGADILVINDFDKNVQVARVTLGTGTTCYASPLNRSLAQEPAKVQASAPQMNVSESGGDVVMYTAMNDAISDVTFLGSRVVKMCNNIPTYWEEPKCGTGVARVKRGLFCGCVRVCVWRRCYNRCWGSC